VYVFDSDDDVVERANNSAYGLAAYVFSKDLGRVWRTVDRLEFGVIGVNEPFPVRPELPFGGMKNSGQEREGGSEGIDAYLETKAVAIRI
jgi:succinate-semialdehyde dehydrogenase/glutarate-semialdehyde dehydrogenase